MSIEQPTIIDSIGTRSADNCCVLVISDHLAWNDWERLKLREKKINNYLAFIESGEIYKARPDAREQSIEISFYSKHTPEGEDDMRFLQLAKNTIQDAGFQFSVYLESGEYQIPQADASNA